MNASKTIRGGVGACFLLAAVSVGWTAPATVYLVKDGIAQGKIFVPERFSYATQLAVEEVQAAVNKMTGAALSVNPGPFTEAMSRSYRSTALVLQPETIGVFTGDAESRDRFTITQERNRIFIRSASEDGVLCGVYTWLDSLGARWYAPGPDGEIMPKCRDIAVIPGTVEGAPAFWERQLWYNGDAYWHFANTPRYEEQYNDWLRWCLRNRLHPQGMGSVAARRIFVTHYIHVAALKGVDLEKEPQRFAYVEALDARFPVMVKDGTGYRIKNDQICLSNADNVKQAIVSSVALLREQPNLIIAPMGLGDFGAVCCCPACLAANGGVDPRVDPSRVAWAFMNAVATGVASEMPGRGIGFFAPYCAIGAPPEDMASSPAVLAKMCHTHCNAHALSDTNCTYNTMLRSQIARIQQAGASIDTYAYTMWYGRVQPLAILESLATFHDLGARTYSCELMGRDELRNIVQWAMARLLWDSTQDPQALLQACVEGLYGAAGPDVLAILKTLDRQIRSDEFITFNPPFDLLTPAVQETCRTLLAQAQKAVTGDEARRLSLFGDSLEMIFRRAEVNRQMAILSQARTAATRDAARQTWTTFTNWCEAVSIFETCSPQLLGAMGGTGKAIDSFSLEYPGPKPQQDVAEGGRAARIAALFTLDTPPQRDEGIFLLPDSWKFSIDLAREGISQGWSGETFDDRAWRDMSVYNFIQNYQQISCWNWYRTQFTAPAFTPGKRIIMRIGALDEEGLIFVNGKQVHERHHLIPNDWTRSFAFDVTDAIRPGTENYVAVLLINREGAAGLWRGVGLYEAEGPE